ncbi:MAG: DUF1080 domain-containing protein [Verrucomicrobiales bacterium]|nr:DUF1080 domain-containing protein [Verrucomicrobiales bacterium]
MTLLAAAVAGTALFSPKPVRADESEAGWVALFNGKDLTNWVNVNCAPETWSVGDGVIHCTGKPIGALRTPRMYENFVLELEWRHLTKGGNAGIFVWASPIAAPGVPFLRAIEVQVLDEGFNVKGKNEWYTTHGDVFPIHGTTMNPIHKGNGMRCFPIEERSLPTPQWNHYRIEGNAGRLRLSVNGKEVSGGDECNWRKGYLGLESEGAPTEWRNIRIKELPPTGAAAAAQTAPEDAGWKSVFSGIDLRGWKTEKEAAWKAGDWQLHAEAGAPALRTAQTITGDFSLVVDCHCDAIEPGSEPSVLAGALRVPLTGKARTWTRFTLTAKNRKVSIQSGQAAAVECGELPEGAVELSLSPGSKAAMFANVYLKQ